MIFITRHFLVKSISPNSRRDQTRLRILNKADELFHRLGFYKTTVADIARELEMSPANIYKFFASKEALVQAVAEWNLSLFKTTIGEALKQGKTSSAKLKVLATTIYQFHKSKFRSDHEMYRLMVAAHDQQWLCVVEFKSFLRRTLAEIIEEGIEAEEFSHLETSIEAEVLFDSLTWIINPLLMFELKNAQVTKRIDAQIRFFERALT
jgi:AcrR family transcriptional regulator